MRIVPRVLVPAAFVVAATGCSMIPVKMNTSMTVVHGDGTVEHKETHWEGTLDQLPAQMAKAGDDLADVTGKMVKELTDVPPPGKVKLSDLSPGLQSYEGNPQCDFLISAKGDDGKPIDFQYVQLGQPSFDKFFKDAQVTYAIVYQADQTLHRLRELSAKISGQKVDASAALSSVVSQALQNSDPDSQSLVSELKQVQQLGVALASLVMQFAGHVTTLIADGEQLVAGAASSLTNPKVVTHLGLVKKGLVDSVTVVKNSGELLVKFGADLGTIASG
ncbi:MAG TPA: hypothetical protein VF765_01425 [Polyangiaceae bacterium]